MPRMDITVELGSTGRGRYPHYALNNHDYFGGWFPKYDPKLHDAIEGPVEEFISEGDTSIGYNEAKAGDTLCESVSARCESLTINHISDLGRTTLSIPGSGPSTRRRTNHVSAGAEGHQRICYVYTKTVRVDGPKPVLTIEHSLKNTGSKPLNTMQYDHNFLMIDGKPTGPECFGDLPLRPSDERPAV